MTLEAYEMTDAPQTQRDLTTAFKKIMVTGKYKSDFLEKMSCFIGHTS